jgi:putative peptidoglycan lipid II flippase
MAHFGLDLSSRPFSCPHTRRHRDPIGIQDLPTSFLSNRRGHGLSFVNISTSEGPAVQSVPHPRILAMNGRIFRAALSVTLAGIFVKLAATSKEFVIAGLYGRSDAMDAFLSASLIPNLLVNVFAESMNQALIPTLVRVRMLQGQRKAQELLSSSMLWMCIFLVLACTVMAISARTFFPLLAWSFPAEKFELCLHLFWALLPMVILAGIASNCAAVLNSVERFTFPALAPVLIPITITVGALLLHARLGIWALVLFATLGTASQAALMAWRMGSHGHPLELRWHGMCDATREVLHQYGPVLLSSVVASGGLLVDQAMAASLPAGSVSTLVFAGRFVSVVVTLLAGAVSTALTPYFSMMVARKDWPGCRKTLRDWGRVVAAVAIPLAAAIILAAHMLVRVTLQHGAFSARDTAEVAPVLALYAAQIPFFAVSRVYYRFVLAKGRTDLILYCGILNLILDIVLDILLMRSMGVAGLALATSLWTVSTCVFFWFCARRLLTMAEAE